MAYSDFTIKQVQKDFNLEIIEKLGFFSNIAPLMLSDYFLVTLEENILFAAPAVSPMPKTVSFADNNK